MALEDAVFLACLAYIFIGLFIGLVTWKPPATLTDAFPILGGWLVTFGWPFRLIYLVFRNRKKVRPGSLEGLDGDGI